MARKNLFSITEADADRPAYSPSPRPEPAAEPAAHRASPPAITDIAPPMPAAEVPQRRRQQAYREGKRAVMFFLSEEAFSQMHVLLAWQGRRKVQSLMEELIDDWFRRENAPRLIK